MPDFGTKILSLDVDPCVPKKRYTCTLNGSAEIGGEHYCELFFSSGESPYHMFTAWEVQREGIWVPIDGRLFLTFSEAGESYPLRVTVSGQLTEGQTMSLLVPYTVTVAYNNWLKGTGEYLFVVSVSAHGCPQTVLLNALPCICSTDTAVLPAMVVYKNDPNCVENVTAVEVHGVEAGLPVVLAVPKRTTESVWAVGHSTSATNVLYAPPVFAVAVNSNFEYIETKFTFADSTSRLCENALPVNAAEAYVIQVARPSNLSPYVDPDPCRCNGTQSYLGIPRVTPNNSPTWQNFLLYRNPTYCQVWGVIDPVKTQRFYAANTGYIIGSPKAFETAFNVAGSVTLSPPNSGTAVFDYVVTKAKCSDAISVDVNITLTVTDPGRGGIVGETSANVAAFIDIGAFSCGACSLKLRLTVSSTNYGSTSPGCSGLDRQMSLYSPDVQLVYTDVS